MTPVELPGILWFHLRISKKDRVNVVLAREDRYREADRDLYNSIAPTRRARKFSGRCYQYNTGQPAATILLRIKYLGSGLVTHEITHAAFHYLTVRQGKAALDKRYEEQLAELIGSLTSQFWKKFYAFEKSGRIKRLKGCSHVA
jgi:hypothetical protein